MSSTTCRSSAPRPAPSAVRSRLSSSSYTSKEVAMTRGRSRATATGLASCLVLAACASGGGNSGIDGHTSAIVTKLSAASSPALSPSIASTVAQASHSGSGRSTAATACSLVQEKDVAAAVGADPGKGTGDDRQGATACSYGSYPGQVLTVNVLRTQARAAYIRSRHDAGLASANRVVGVSGLGDQAFELSRPHADVIYFTKGEALVVIGVTAPSAPTKGAALTLAKIAVNRL
jgi:hypothetical protein